MGQVFCHPLNLGHSCKTASWLKAFKVGGKQEALGSMFIYIINMSEAIFSNLETLTTTNIYKLQASTIYTQTSEQDRSCKQLPWLQSSPAKKVESEEAS